MAGTIVDTLNRTIAAPRDGWRRLVQHFTRRLAQLVLQRPAGIATGLVSGLLLALLFSASPAQAQCFPNTPAGGTTTCSGSPGSFPGGGAAVQGGNSNLNVNSLSGNIVPGGGVAGAASVFAPGPASDGGGFPVHGFNGDDGSGGPDITINFTGTGAGFLTQTNNAAGIVAISKGQQGGKGGTGFGGPVPCPIPPLFVCPVPGIGGNGGNGGTGGNVSVFTTGSGLITTSGNNNHGIFALSQGGTGGQGGDGDTFVSIGVGGDGHNGGAPKAVTVNNVLSITTTGGGAAGIWAQSVGAAGGAAGSANGLNLVGFGGSGAAASDGGTVNVTNNSVIITQADGAIGIFAQSVGGYAGSGGGSIGVLSFGGSSSSAGNGGQVSVTTNGGSIHTSGVGATAIFAQSGGGGGGAGGFGGGLVGFGGGGSTGGFGQRVSVTNRANLTVDRDLSSGIFAQSFGGGGGTAGIGVGLVGIGGNGGGGGNGGDVDVHNFNTILLGGSGSLNPGSGSAMVAAGIYAQSVGGGGGNGALGAGIVGVGGSGGAAGNGFGVFVENFGNIIHSACGNCIEAPTIFAQSVGGGGGDGGSSGGLVAVGGHGSGGGNGGLVTVNNSANLTAYGDMSAGMFAQSVGGGGGNGGSSLGVGLFVSVAVGGTGGGGGNGGNICVNGNGACNGVIGGLGTSIIATHGFRSPGILAQSVGGGGGNGGSAISASAGIYGSASFGIGGDGSNGGTGGNVFVAHRGGIITAGDYSPGIDASSVGGGGGNGGFAISATGGATFVSLGIALGGAGGAGNHSGVVTVNSAANIQTAGKFAPGIEGHSIGGGGGNGGFTVAVAGAIGAALTFDVGGTGGKGADGDVVNITSVGNITTGQAGNSVGDFSAGIFAESVGGSGGSGGFAIAVGGAAYGTLNAALGGKGGDGGNGKSVFVNNNTAGTIGNRITTFNTQSEGIFAQSIGGSGGSGGFAVSAGGSQFATINLSFGGSGALGGNGGDVLVNSFGAIETHGDKSSGIFAQSVGGGGGSGGFAASVGGAIYGALSLSLGGGGAGGGDAGNVMVNNTAGAGGIETFGKRSNGIFAQSVGGGGGDGGLAIAAAGSQYASFALAFGGSGGRGGIGRDVRVDSSGPIITHNDQANGIFAQSLGGSGGNGGLAVSGTLTINSGFSGALSLSIGGKGGTGATGGFVHVGNTGDIVTNGFSSDGILAQSIGGSGGNGGISGALGVAAGGATFVSGTGGEGGSGNKAGGVEVFSVGNILTQKTNSTGILAQSVGGGGGNGGFSLTLSATYDATIPPPPGTKPNSGIGGHAGIGGTASAVTVVSNGAIHTTADLSDGILAQSVGGGGGRGGFAIGAALSFKGATAVNAVGGDGGSGNDAGQVHVTANATAASSPSGYSIFTQGNNSVGILAQSVGGGGGDGGFAVGLSFNAGSDANGNVVGGSGNAGGKSVNNGAIPAVQVDNTGIIVTLGRNSGAIIAQSIGGGGGNGGFSIGVAGTVSDSDSKLQSVGGAGGVGNSAGDVVVNNNNSANSTGLVITSQDLSTGILAQSVGGGGGNGGFSIAGSLSTGGGAEANATGGHGAGGGDAGNVTVNSGGGILTGSAGFGGARTGQASIGILAQAIGGGGGNGGFSGGLALGIGGDSAVNSTGGNGGAAGEGGNVTVTTQAGAFILTFGDNAAGILAQSVGGGGGNGGFSIGASFSNSDGKSATNLVGGKGVGGGGGHDVTVNNKANINTFGLMSDGIIAQSIGGGGGNGGFAIGGSLSLGGDAQSNTTGGQGGAGGNGGSVTVTNSGNIEVNQVGTIGILAQSVGGGGGNGGFAGGLVFSNSGDTVNNSIGGNGAGGGNGGIVKVTNSGTIDTLGSLSTGILAQSVGGGGGNGGFAISAGGASQGKSETQTIGGSGGAGGIGQGVTVTNNSGGTITTNGDLSIGILAQSVGGGGGNGGFALAAAFSLQGDAKSTVGGGAGGAGGSAGEVKVENSDTITTKGGGSIGILAQSVGGGGGNGGFAGGLAFANNGKVDNTVGGGAGGAGNTPSSVTVTNHLSGIIHTKEANSIGILAQAVGGGGGSGGFSISGAGASGGDGLSNSVGGTGGTGGSIPVGVLVKVQNDGQIITDAGNSAGILAQSIGGGGGSGGISVAGAYSSSGGATSSVGGGGSAGGSGGAVDVENTGSILVKGPGSVGIFAQSVGGGGGNAGFSGALNFTNGGMLNNTVGGSGAGGNGGDVTVNSTGSITTISDDSVSVIAQSVGGGGGNGSFAISAQSGSLDGSALQIGGSAGGPPGTNGIVIVNIKGGTVNTRGAFSYGILAQSVGAGGGNGALSVPDPLTIGALGVTQTVGASGAISGNGNVLTTTNSNPVVTAGAGAMGFVGQTIGGGGGTSGVSGDVTFTAAGPLKIIAGGSSTGGGHGGAANVTNNASSIETGSPIGAPALGGGDAAVGILAQTIGGGGGSAVFALGNVIGSATTISQTLGGSEQAVLNNDNGGLLTLATGGAVTTHGRFAPGVVGQTIGGGGGFGAVTAPVGISAAAITFTLGSTGGVGGNADPSNGSTWTINPGAIVTEGALSDGIVAQAIGAGGGLSGFVSSGAQAPALTGVKLGAGAGTGNGATVTLNNQSSVTTTGRGAVGLIAQSIGGGGGIAQADGVSGNGPVSLGATGGASGNGGKVAATSQGAIKTSGINAHGFIAQSIGGGGGFFVGFGTSGAPIVTQVQAGAGGGGGNGGDVVANNNADINTTGAGAHGIIAQSVGGGGGIVGGGVFAVALPTNGPFAGSAGGNGTAGAVTVGEQANVVVTGVDSTAIFAQSADKTGRGGPINITIAASKLVSGGAGNGNAVRLAGGAANLLTNSGTITTVSAINGMTVTGGVGDDAIVNFGHMIGSIDLTTGANSLDNKPYSDTPPFSGVFDMGSTVFLGAGNLFTNEGVMSPGALLFERTTNVTGNLIQTPTGFYALDVEFHDQTSDRINVTGTAKVQGNVVIDILNPGQALPGAHDTIIVSAAGGATDPGLGLQYQPTAVANYSLTNPLPTDIDLHFVIDFSPAGLTKNQHAVGNVINAIQTARVQSFIPIAAAIFYQPTVKQLGQVYDSLSGEGVTGVQQTSFDANDLFMMAVQRQNGFWVEDAEAGVAGSRILYNDKALGYAPRNPAHPAFAGLTPIIPQRTWRTWISGQGGSARYKGDPDGVGYASLTRSGGNVAAGFDYQINPNTLLGLAAGYGRFSYSVPQRETTGTVEGGHVALYSAWRDRQAYATAMFGIDFFGNKERRHASIPGTVLPPLFGTQIPAIPGFDEHPAGSFRSHSFSGALEAGYRQKFGNFEVTPFVGLQFSSLNTDAFQENNNGAKSTVGLAFKQRTIGSLPTFLGAQISASRDMENGTTLTGYLRASWKHEFFPRRSTNAAFLAAPGFNFVVDGAQPPEDAARISAGAKLDFGKDVSFFANFGGDFAPRYQNYSVSGGIKANW